MPVIKMLFASLLVFTSAKMHAETMQTSYTETSELPKLAADEAYVLVGVNIRGPQIQGSGVTFTDNESGSHFTAAANTGSQLIRVKSGTYLPQRLVFSGDRKARVKALSNGQKTDGIVIEPQTITYIGNWTITNSRRFTVNGQRFDVNSASYAVRYNPNLLARSAENFAATPTYAPAIAGTGGQQLKATWERSSLGTVAGISY